MQLRRRRLGEPDDALVVAEVLVAQLRVAVEAEPADDHAVEGADEEVGQEVRARLVLGAVDLVAVRALEPAVAGEVGSAIGVGDDDDVVPGGLGDGGTDLLRAVVQRGRDGSHLDVPAPASGDRLDLERERPAGDDDARGHPGKASWSTKRSLKSPRPESSTYSTSSSTAAAA